MLPKLSPTRRALWRADEVRQPVFFPFLPLGGSLSADNNASRSASVIPPIRSKPASSSVFGFSTPTNLAISG